MWASSSIAPLLYEHQIVSRNLFTSEQTWVRVSSSIASLDWLTRLWADWQIYLVSRLAQIGSPEWAAGIYEHQIVSWNLSRSGWTWVTESSPVALLLHEHQIVSWKLFTSDRTWVRASSSFAPVIYCMSTKWYCETCSQSKHGWEHLGHLHHSITLWAPNRILKLVLT